jgi:2-oxoglutarate dehydrogenase E2 component (dihydrolipoamide succinyltransferase)
VKDGTIRLLKKVGDKVTADETIAEIETDKTNLSVNVPQAGTIEAFLVADGDNVTSGAQIAKINTSGGGAKSAPVEEKKNTSTDKIDAEKTKDESGKSTDKVDAKQTEEKPSAVTPSEGSKRDTSPSLKPSPSARQQLSGNDPNKISGTRSETRVKMSRMRLKIAERLKEAQNTCAMLTTFNEIDMRYR